MGTRGVSKKKTRKKKAQTKKQSSVHLDEAPSGQVEPEKILNLGREMGLKPIFSGNDTISVIIKRLTKD